MPIGIPVRKTVDSRILIGKTAFQIFFMFCTLWGKSILEKRDNRIASNPSVRQQKAASAVTVDSIILIRKTAFMIFSNVFI